MMFTFNLSLEKRPLQYTAAITCLLTTITSGIHCGWPSPYLPILLRDDSPIPITNDESSWVAVIFLMGGPVAAIVAGIILDIVGRKKVLLLSTVPFTISWILIVFAKTLPQLLIARFLAGFGEGLVYGVTPIYFGEICDPEIRGLLGCCITISYLTGIVLSNIVGSYLSMRDSAIFFALIPFIFLISFIWMPESPNFFLMKGDKEKARCSMLRIKGSQDADKNLEQVARAIEEETLNSTRFVSLFKNTNRKCLLVVIGLLLTQQFSGVMAFKFYAQTVFQETGASISPLHSVMIFYAVQIMFSSISSMLIDKVGRKPLLIISTAGSGIALLVVGVFFFIRDGMHLDTTKIAWLPIVLLIAFILSFSIALQSVPLFIAAEIFPTNVKAYAEAIIDVCYYTFALIASKYFQVTKDIYGIHVPIITFALCCALGLIIIVYFVPETKNKTLEEIQIELNKK